MYWIYYILLIITSAASLGLVVVTLPGLWLMAALAGVYTLATGERYIGWHTLIVLVLLALLGEIMELFMSGASARKVGGSRRAMLGGVIGGISGGIVFTFVPIPVVGTLLGICVGTFVGAAGTELMGGGDAGHSFRVGVGATKGRLLGILAKVITGLLMLLIIIWTAWP
jgi:uncharacterized protein YqgC (DUF456 family)